MLQHVYGWYKLEKCSQRNTSHSPLQQGHKSFKTVLLVLRFRYIFVRIRLQEMLCQGYCRLCFQRFVPAEIKLINFSQENKFNFVCKLFKQFLLVKSANQGCGSGYAWICIHFSSWIWIQTKERRTEKNARKFLIIEILLKFLERFGPAPWFFFILVGNPSICRFQLQKTPHKVIVTNLFQLDPDQHFKSSWIRIGIEKNIWIRIRKKMRIHCPAANRRLDPAKNYQGDLLNHLETLWTYRACALCVQVPRTGWTPDCRGCRRSGQRTARITSSPSAGSGQTTRTTAPTTQTMSTGQLIIHSLFPPVFRIRIQRLKKEFKMLNYHK